jgi:hypothetical protein
MEFRKRKFVRKGGREYEERRCKNIGINTAMPTYLNFDGVARGVMFTDLWTVRPDVPSATAT